MSETPGKKTQQGAGWIWAVVAGGVVLSILFACFAGALGGWFAGRLAAGQYTRTFMLPMERPWDMPWDRRWDRSWDEMVPVIPTPQAPTRPTPAVPPPGSEQDTEKLRGALIREVVPGSPADRAGIQIGDILLAIDNVQLDVQHTLPVLMGQYQPGDRIMLTVLRDQERMNIRLNLGGREDDPSRPYLGVTYVEIPFPDWVDRFLD